MTTVAFPPRIVATVREFVERDVRPTAPALEHADQYPNAQVARMRDLGLSGEEGQLQAFTVERHYRDTPLMIIGEGTNEIQRTIIARQLLERYGERMGALTSREGESEERRQIVLAVRQFVEKTVAPLARESEAHPAEPMAQLADLGVLGATAAPDDGGLGVDLETCAMILEELARGSAALAGVVATHLAVIGVAQAAFEAALRYSQQRSTFGKPICQHQAVQLKLADMATAITASRLLTYDGARQLERGGNDTGLRLARIFASEAAADVTLDAMRIHGGYGYTTEFPVERYYRDAACLVVSLGGNDGERHLLADRLRSEA